MQQMNKLYPLKFKPILKDKIWGGERIKSKLGIDFAPLPNCGEAWVLSGVEGFQSVVENGWLAGNQLNELVEIYMEDLVGDDVFEEYGTEFPVLIKFIDAKDWLSIQVHPDDELAAKRNIGRGKTEMWYIIDAGKDAELISGFSRKIDRETYLNHLKNKKLKEVLNFEEVNTGDVFFMPAGRVHALGPGIMLAEIQQTSDTTYRIFDWDRIQPDGTFRELHTKEALDAIDFNVYPDYKTHYKKEKNKTATLAQCPYFTTNLLDIDQGIKKDLRLIDSFIAYVCLEGDVILDYSYYKTDIKPGEVVLVPAITEQINIIPVKASKLLELYIV
jgi:mannose-6-phosphate isomerase